MRMRDIARELGVSTMTVSRALKQDASVAPATREAVLAAIARLGYVPNEIAGSLSSNRTRFVAVLVPSLNNTHFSQTVQTLSAALEAEGLQLLLGHTAYDRRRECDLVRAMLGRKPEAVVLTSDGHAPELEVMLARAGIPVIEMWDVPERPLGSVVGFSNRVAMRSLVEALIGEGFSRITYVGEMQDIGMRGAARRQGYMDALARHNLGPPRLCSVGHPPVTMSDGEEALVSVLTEFPDTDLIVCVSDPLAFGVIAACQRRGLSVPDDVAVAGFGDFEVSRIANPAITTLSVNASEIGREVAEMLGRLRAGKPAASLPPRLVETRPILRASTARPHVRPEPSASPE